MKSPNLLTPTIHVEVLVADSPFLTIAGHGQVRDGVKKMLIRSYACLKLGESVKGFKLPTEDLDMSVIIMSVHVADYTGPPEETGIHSLSSVELDVHSYTLKTGGGIEHRRGSSDKTDMLPQALILALPSVQLKEEWSSLIFEDGLHSRLLRFLVRTIGIMGRSDLDARIYNWNRLCLLHGPPGSGKSTLCRALAQKLSIRLSDQFPQALLVELDSNELLSKYFGESGKIISEVFHEIEELAQERDRLVIVVIDEVETIAGSRAKSSNGLENSDGLRVTNQLLKALDRIRHLSNVFICCTSNLIEAIDPAFFDRVDNKQYIPIPSIIAMYNIFRNCLNELVRTQIITHAGKTEVPNTDVETSSGGDASTSWLLVQSTPVPSWDYMNAFRALEPTSVGCQVWALAKRSKGMSGRALRRLSVLGLAVYTWGGDITLDDAIAALDSAINDEINASGRSVVQNQ